MFWEWYACGCFWNHKLTTGYSQLHSCLVAPAVSCTVEWDIGLCFCSGLSVQWDDSILCKNYQSCPVMGKKCAYCLNWQVVIVATMSGCSGECQRKHCSVSGLPDSCYVDCKQLKKCPNKTGFALYTIKHSLDVIW